MITVKLEGWKELAVALKKLPQNMSRNVIRGALDRGAKVIAEKARATSDFKDRTGKLRKGIEVRRLPPTATTVQSSVRVATKVAPHAHLIEYGWMQRTKDGSRHIPGTHFMEEALEENRKDIITLVTLKIRELLGKKLAKLKN